MLLNTYYRYHNHSTTWKSNGNVTVLFCLFLSDHLARSKIHFCSVNGCPSLLLLWEPPGEEMTGSSSPAGLTARGQFSPPL